MKIGPHTIEPATVLAPMAAITNPPFRQICLEQGVGLTTCEVLSAGQMLAGREPLPIERAPGERILVVQIYGRVPGEVARAARVAVEHGADVVDLNMGCPARKVVKQGAGVALMREPDLAAMVTRAVVAAVDVPVTVKMRAGWGADEANAATVARAVAAAGARAVTIHARLREAVHTGPFDWRVVREVRDALPPEVTVVGNGGVTSPDDARELLASTGCDGVMIGRAARGNPWIFGALAGGDALGPISPAEVHRVVLRHLDLYVEWGGEARAVVEMRKHLCWYLRRLPRAAKLRARLAGLHTRDDMARLVGEIVPEADEAAPA
jgi:tRNA-dihydrouridine synthase B